MNNRKQWMRVFYCLNGELTPQQIGIYDPKIMLNIFSWVKLILILSKISFYAFIIIPLFIFVYILITESESIIHLIMWLIWLIPNIFYMYIFYGTISISFLCFFITCYYCRIRCIHLNANIDLIISIAHKIKQKFFNKYEMKSIIREHNAICNDIVEYNNFWKGYYHTNLFVLIPANLMLTHQLIFSQLNLLTFLIYFMTIIGTWIYILVANYLTASASHILRKSYKKISKMQWIINYNITVTKIKVFNEI